MSTSWRRLEECVFCPKGLNLNCLSVSSSSYKCFRCNRSGSFAEFEHARIKYEISPPPTRAASQPEKSFFPSPTTSPILFSSVSLPTLSRFLVPLTFSALLISGRPGVGKTTLLNQLVLDNNSFRTRLPTLYSSLSHSDAFNRKSLTHQKTPPTSLYFFPSGLNHPPLSHTSLDFAVRSLHVKQVVLDSVPWWEDAVLMCAARQYPGLKVACAVHPRRKIPCDLALPPECLVSNHFSNAHYLVDDVVLLIIQRTQNRKYIQVWKRSNINNVNELIGEVPIVFNELMAQFVEATTTTTGAL